MHAKRTIIGILVGSVVGLLMAYGPMPLIYTAIVALATIATIEYYALAKAANKSPYTTLGTLLGIIYLASVIFIPSYSSAILCTFPFLIATIALFDRNCKDYFSSTCSTAFGIAYIPLSFSYLVRLASYETGEHITRSGVFLVFFVCAIVKLSDTGAFAIGIPFGKHKMFPRISPKKSWEGLAGAFLAGIGVAVGLALLALKYKWGPDGVFYATSGTPLLTLGKTAILATILVAIGVVGDLIESAFKRCANIKDSSTIFAGMGGILDVFDSIIFAIPTFFFILQQLPCHCK